jgi:hypothetical protein
VGGVRNRKRTQPDSIHKTEDGRVCANSKRQRDNGRQIRPGCAHESAKEESNVIDKVDQFFSFPCRLGHMRPLALYRAARVGSKEQFKTNPLRHHRKSTELNRLAISGALLALLHFTIQRLSLKRIRLVSIVPVVVVRNRQWLSGIEQTWPDPIRPLRLLAIARSQPISSPVHRTNPPLYDEPIELLFLHGG